LESVIEHVVREVAAAGKGPGVLALWAQGHARHAGGDARLFATGTTGIVTQALKQAAQMGQPAGRRQ
jgi:2-keto-3-deoxy-L-rhamnonate aldolase RhmA